MLSSDTGGFIFKEPSCVTALPDGEICVCDLADAIEVSQPTASHHAKVLVAAGLIEREQRGRWAYYRVVEGALDELSAVLRLPERADV